MIISLILTLFTTISWSQVNLELKIAATQVKQGEIVNAKIIYRGGANQFPGAALKGKNIAKTLYLMQLSPFMGKQGQEYLQSEAKVIFLEVPKENNVTETVSGQDINIHWSELEVLPVEAPKSFLFGDFQIPERINFARWIWPLFAAGLLLILILWIWRKVKTKKLITQRLSLLKGQLLQASSYEEIVTVWQNKHLYLQTFPQLDETFRKFETVLFKYQFKPSRKDFEIKEVQEAYQNFKSQAGGILNGI